MAGQLRPSEAATRGLKRLLLRQLDDGLRLLAAPELDDAAVHDLRRDLKRSRAYLLLLRPVLGKPCSRRLDAQLDAVAHVLGPLRDRRVLRDAVESLSSHGGDPLFDHFAAAIRREADDGAGEAPRARLARGARVRLLRLRAVVRDMRVPRGNWSALGPGLRRTYRRARRALHEARDTGRDETLHGWRRWAKSLRFQLRVLEVLDASFRQQGARLDELGDLLGRYHDLLVLRGRVTASASFAADPEGGARFLSLLDPALAMLRDEAYAVGAPLFADRPREFERRLRDRWRAWRRRRSPAPR